MIEAPTAENFVPLLGEYVMDYTMNGRVRTQVGNEHWTNAPHNSYRCQGEDRWITVGVWNEEQWRSLCGLMRQENLVEDPRFIDMASRFENRHELDSTIGEWTGTRQPHWLVERLQAAGVPSGVVMNERDALEDRHLHERGFWHSLDHPEAGNYRHVGPAWKASQTPNDTPRRHAPLLGQDNEYVYKTVLGYTDDEYRDLEEKGQIGMDFAPEVP
jgi:benzylsuccinate CoA-transferase BbsF subunit